MQNLNTHSTYDHKAQGRHNKQLDNISNNHRSLQTTHAGAIPPSHVALVCFWFHFMWNAEHKAEEISTVENVYKCCCFYVIRLTLPCTRTNQTPPDEHADFRGTGSSREPVVLVALFEDGFQGDQAEWPFLFDCPLPPVW